MFDWVLNTPLSLFCKITLKVSESKEKGSNDNVDERTSNDNMDVMITWTRETVMITWT